MQNFDIEGVEGATNDDLSHSVKKNSTHSQPHQQSVQKLEEMNKTYDDFDPINCAFTCGFKIVSILIYLLLKLLTDSYLSTFVITVLLISFDFWVTKNLTARKLVGLRWWSQIAEDGQQQWIFESRNPSRVTNALNAAVFWISELVAVLFWAVIVIINFFTISIFWIGLALFCEGLTVINFICFFKCRGQHQGKALQLGQKFGLRMIGI